MHVTLDLGGVFVGMAGEAKPERHSRDQLHAGDIFVDPDLMAGETACSHGGVHGFALVLVAMTFKALGLVRVLFERNRVNARKRPN